MASKVHVHQHESSADSHRDTESKDEDHVDKEQLAPEKCIEKHVKETYADVVLRNSDETVQELKAQVERLYIGPGTREEKVQSDTSENYSERAINYALSDEELLPVVSTPIHENHELDHEPTQRMKNASGKSSTIYSGPMSRYYEFLMNRSRRNSQTHEKYIAEFQSKYSFVPSINKESDGLAYERRPRANSSESICSWVDKNINPRNDRLLNADTDCESNEPIHKRLLRVDQLLKLHESVARKNVAEARMKVTRKQNKSNEHSITPAQLSNFLERNENHVQRKRDFVLRETGKQMPKHFELLPNEIDEFIVRCSSWHNEREQLLLQKRKQKKDIEMQQCTFKPSIPHRVSKTKDSSISNLSFAERSNLFQHNRERKLEEERDRKREQLAAQCTFYPQTTVYKEQTSLERAKQRIRSCRACDRKHSTCKKNETKLDCACHPNVRAVRKDIASQRLKRPFTSSRIKYAWLSAKELEGRGVRSSSGLGDLPNDVREWNELEVDTAIARARVSRFLEETKQVSLSGLIQRRSGS